MAVVHRSTMLPRAERGAASRKLPTRWRPQNSSVSIRCLRFEFAVLLRAGLDVTMLHPGLLDRSAGRRGSASCRSRSAFGGWGGGGVLGAAPLNTGLLPPRASNRRGHGRGRQHARQPKTAHWFVTSREKSIHGAHVRDPLVAEGRRVSRRAGPLAGPHEGPLQVA